MPEASVTPDDVQRAAGAIRGAVHRTPTFTSRSLGPGRHLKAELFQRTGSFKARGALNRVRALSPDERRAGVISVSAGNHAQALAWAAATEHLDALLVMWQGASAAKIEATRGYGAAVDLEAPGPGAAFDHSMRVRKRATSLRRIAGTESSGASAPSTIPDSSAEYISAKAIGVGTAPKARNTVG